MKITKRQLRRIITESLLEQDAEEEKVVEKPDVNLDVSADKNPNAPRLNLRINPEGKASAQIVNPESGEVIQTLDDPNNEETKQQLFGFLRAALEDAKDTTAKMGITKAFARLLGDSEEDEDATKNMAKYLNDREFASYAQKVRADAKKSGSGTA